MVSATDLIDAAIADLEAKLNLAPGGCIPNHSTSTKVNQDVGCDTQNSNNKAQTTSAKDTRKNSVSAREEAKKSEKSNVEKGKTRQNTSKKGNVANLDQPDICKLEFKVGKIIKVWVHPEADKLYCEKIDCGEEKPRDIASGLRVHYLKEEMLGRRVLVVANLKTRKLAGFPSSGMVLCASEKKDDGTERVEFIEPPEGAVLGEIVTFEGLPFPEPFSSAQVEKRKVFQACLDGMKTTEDGLASWDGHIFQTSAGPCKSISIKGGPMR